MWRVVGIVLCLASCTNEPGALTLTIIPERPEFSTDEPIVLRTVLSSGRNPVCLSKSHHYAAEMHRTAPEMMEVKTDFCHLFCGLEYIPALFTWPVMLPASLLDVGDVGHRFDIIEKGQERWSNLELVSVGPSEQPRLRVVIVRVSSNLSYIHKAWAPGDYVIHLRLDNQHFGPFPPPLFWKPYDQPVEAETTIRIVERDEPSETSPAN